MLIYQFGGNAGQTVAHLHEFEFISLPSYKISVGNFIWTYLLYLVVGTWKLSKSLSQQLHTITLCASHLTSKLELGVPRLQGNSSGSEVGCSTRSALSQSNQPTSNRPETNLGTLLCGSSLPPSPLSLARSPQLHESLRPPRTVMSRCSSSHIPRRHNHFHLYHPHQLIQFGIVPRRGFGQYLEFTTALFAVGLCAQIPK